MTSITVIARDARGGKSTWHYTPAAELSLEEHLQAAREQVITAVAQESKAAPWAVLALVPK